jgi:hypothetical protein
MNSVHKLLALVVAAGGVYTLGAMCSHCVDIWNNGDEDVTVIRAKISDVLEPLGKGLSYDERAAASWRGSRASLMVDMKDEPVVGLGCPDTRGVTYLTGTSFYDLHLGVACKNGSLTIAASGTRSTKSGSKKH